MVQKIRVDLPIDIYQNLLYKLILVDPVQQEVSMNPRGWLLKYVRKLECYKWCEQNSSDFMFTVSAIVPTIITPSSNNINTKWLYRFYFEFGSEDDAMLFKVIFG